MGKTALCIRMLQILNTGRIYNVSELAEILNTNPRNIYEYKKELDEISVDSGFYIETIPGKYGGYKLNGNAIIPSIKMTPSEKETIVEAYNYVLTKKDFLKKKEFISGFSKIMSNINVEEKQNDLMVVDKYQLSMEEKDIQERYNFIEEAIKLKRVIQLEYYSLKHGLKTHILHPYKLFIYNNSWFFLAWNPEVSDVWYFKVNRIKEYKLLNEKFEVWKFFKPEDYFDKQGLKQNGNYYHIEFIATGTRAILMEERVYGKNQIIEDLEDGSVKVSLDMQNDDAIVSFALGCGTDITILEPEWLIERVKEKIVEIHRRYEKE